MIYKVFFETSDGVIFHDFCCEDCLARELKRSSYDGFHCKDYQLITSGECSYCGKFFPELRFISGPYRQSSSHYKKNLVAFPY